MEQPTNDQPVPLHTQQTVPTPVAVITPDAPAPTAPPGKPGMVRYAMVGIALLLVLGIVVLFKKTQTTSVTPEVKTTPTSVPTSTPSQHVSAIATTSAFRAFSENVASLSATINAFTLQDGAFTPPALDLEIGFSTE